MLKSLSVAGLNASSVGYPEAVTSICTLRHFWHTATGKRSTAYSAAGPKIKAQNRNTAIQAMIDNYRDLRLKRL